MKINTFEEATAVITTLNSITGLRNLEYPVNRWRFLFTWFYDILIICMFSATILAFEPYHNQQLSFHLERMTYIFLNALNMVSLLSMIILGLYYSKDTLELKKRITEVDENLKRLGSTTSYRDLFYWVIIIGTLWTFITLISCGFYVNWLTQQNMGLLSVIAMVNYIYSTNIGAIILYEFVIYVCWLGLRFKQVNDLLKTFLVDGTRIKTEENLHQFPNSLNKHVLGYYVQQLEIFSLNPAPSLGYETQAARRVHLLRQIRLVQLQLYKVAKMVNRIFNTQLLIYSFITALLFTIVLYYIYVEIHKTSFGFLTDLGIVLINLINVFCSSMKIWLAGYNCENTSKEANKIKEIIHASTVYEFDTEMNDEHISFVVSYLVIMIQWGHSYQSEKPRLIKNWTNYNSK